MRATRQTDGGWAVETLLPDKGVTCLATDQNNPNLMYAGTQKQGVWISEDSGITWNAGGLEDQHIKSWRY